MTVRTVSVTLLATAEVAADTDAEASEILRRTGWCAIAVPHEGDKVDVSDADLVNVGPSTRGEYDDIPPATIAALLDYAVLGHRPGGALGTALKWEADWVMRADERHQQCLRAVLVFIYNRLPALARGGPAKVAAWRGLQATMTHEERVAWAAQAVRGIAYFETGQGPEFWAQCRYGAA